MAVTEAEVLRALSGVGYPGFTRDIVAFGVVKDLVVSDGAVTFRIELGPGNPAVFGTIEREARSVLATLPGVTSVTIDGAPPAAAARVGKAPAPGALDATLLPGVKHTIAVASGKGGVGKSTIAVNLAVGLAQRGAQVGLLDADIYGPSIPLMMGVDRDPDLDPGTRSILPFDRFGVRFMSLGFLVPKEAAVIWRGPMVMKAIERRAFIRSGSAVRINAVGLNRQRAIEWGLYVYWCWKPWAVGFSRGVRSVEMHRRRPEMGRGPGGARGPNRGRRRRIRRGGGRLGRIRFQHEVTAGLVGGVACLTEVRVRSGGRASRRLRSVRRSVRGAPGRSRP